MAKLKDKLENLLNSIGVKVDLEESNDRIGGIIISSIFYGMDQIDRQNKVWDYLESKLNQTEVNKIVTLATVTPLEFNAYTEDF